MQLFLDMDEVLADFIGGACRVWGTTEAEVLPHWTRGVWNIIPPLSRALKLPELTEAEFWAPIVERGEDFWRSLPMLPWARELVDLVHKLSGGDWYVLTSPGPHPSALTGKARWLRGRLGIQHEQMIPTPHKHLLAAPGRILVDDREDNCRDWYGHLGKAVVFPRWHNYYADYRANPLPIVEAQLRELARSTEGIACT